MPVGPVKVYFREDGSGAPVLFIQGLGVDHRGWAPVASRLAAQFRCISFDNRDTGRSSLTEDPYDVVDMAGDAIGLLDGLDIPAADIVGVSMGGVIGQEIAIRRPERVRRLVLITTYTSGDPRGSAIFGGQALLRRTLSREDYCRATFWSVYSHQDYRREDGFVETMIARTASDEGWQPQEAYERHVRATTSAHTEDRLREIKCPTLILAGAEDILTPLRFSQTLAAGIPRNRLAVIEGAGHGMIWSHPEIVVDHIQRFLSG